MTLLQRLFTWVRRFLGRPTETTADPTTYRCAICGTPVRSTDNACPLCQSTDIEPTDERTTRPPDGTLAGQRPQEVTVSDSDDRGIGDILGDHDILSAYRTYWRAHESRTGYVVQLPEGRTTRVDSKDEVRTLLYQHYGAPSSPDIASPD